MNSATVPAASEAGTTRTCGASATLNTGARSFIGSKDSACSRNGLTTRLPPAQIISVWPSALERTTKSIATLPEAPEEVGDSSRRRVDDEPDRAGRIRLSRARRRDERERR